MKTALFLWLASAHDYGYGAGSLDSYGSCHICSTSGVEIYKVLGTESDITHLIDRFYRNEFNHKAVYQLLTAHLKNPPLEFYTLSNMVGYLGFALFLWGLASVGGAPLVL